MHFQKLLIEFIFAKGMNLLLAILIIFQSIIICFYHIKVLSSFIVIASSTTNKIGYFYNSSCIQRVFVFLRII